MIIAVNFQFKQLERRSLKKYFFRLLPSNCLNWKFTVMITPHFLRLLYNRSTICISYIFHINCLSCLRGKRRLYLQVIFWKLPKQSLDNILLSTFYTGLFLLCRKKTGGGTGPPGPSPCYGTVLPLKIAQAIVTNEGSTVAKGQTISWYGIRMDVINWSRLGFAFRAVSTDTAGVLFGWKLALPTTTQTSRRDTS